MIENVKPKGRLKTPISYYGGKQSMLKHILPLIPEHKAYAELFFGGGAVFWAKDPAEAEIINDYNGMVANFYEQLKSNFKQLKKVIDATPYSRQTYQRALVVYDNPYLFSPEVKAWAFWISTVQGFSNKIGSWRGSTNTNKGSLQIDNKKHLITPELSKRLDLVQIECKDAIYLIEWLDSPDTFFYLDPPYVNSDQGHYGGYTQEHFNRLLDALSKIKGKFLLSSYPNDELDLYRKKYGWNNDDKNMQLSASKSKSARKTECLTYNYTL
jgi:DNA adenine methylase